MLRLVDLVVSRGVGISSLGSIVMALLPSFLVLTLPLACLIASVSAFNRMSFDNEIIAIRAAGVSLWRILLPVVVFSAMVYGLTVFLSQWGQPWSNISLKKVALSVIQKELTMVLDSGVFNEPTPGLIVYVPHSESVSEKKGVFISDQRNPDRPLIVVARNFRMLKPNAKNQMGIRLYEGAIHQIPQDNSTFHRLTFGTYDFWLPSPFGNLDDRVKRKSYDELLVRWEETQGKKSSLLRRFMEYHKDTAFPLATFILGLLGVPVGMVSKRTGKAGGFALGVLIIIGFYLFNVLAEFLVNSRLLSPFAGAWLPNLLLLLIAGWFFNKARKV